jgi:hypothetical protein
VYIHPATQKVIIPGSKIFKIIENRPITSVNANGSIIAILM